MIGATRHNPGPGAYEPKTNISPTGNYCLSTMKNSLAPSFSLPSLSKLHNKGGKSNMPGPGTYDMKGIADVSSSFLSTYTGPKARTFYHFDRKTIDIPKSVKSKNLNF